MLPGSEREAIDQVLLSYLHTMTTGGVVVVWPGGDRRREFRLDYPAPADLFTRISPVTPSGADCAPAPADGYSHRCMRAVLSLLGDLGRRLTVEEIGEALAERGEDWGERCVRATLAFALDTGDLVYARDSRGRGYGLARWA